MGKSLQIAAKQKIIGQLRETYLFSEKCLDPTLQQFQSKVGRITVYK